MPVNSFENYLMTWKPDREKLTRPYYLTLADMLERDIALGILPPNTKLPPQRELADYLDINFTTITRMYKVCEQKSLIYAITGKGTFVAPNAMQSITISRDQVPSHMIDLGFVSSYERLNQMVMLSAKDVLDKPYLDELFSARNTSGMPHQRQAAMQWVQQFGIQTDIDHIAIASGSHNAMTITLAALFQPNDKIATDIFTYSNYIELAKLLNLKLVPIAGDENGMLPDELEAACRQSNIQGVFLVPSCASPTTVMISDARKHELAKVIDDNELILIEDDAHAFLTAGVIDDYKQPMFQLLPERTVYICSTSKSLCTGLRVSFMVFGEWCRKRILDALLALNVKTSSLDAEIVSELITSGKAHELVRKKRELAEASNKIYYEVFDHVPRVGHPLSFFRWLPIAAHLHASQLEHDLMQKGVRVLHSDRFVVSRNIPDKYLRFSLSSVDTMEELRSGLQIVKDHLRQETTA